MRPVIGVSSAWSVETWGDSIISGGYSYVGMPYNDAIYRSGGLPVMLMPPMMDYPQGDLVEALLNTIDGLLLSGGGDVKNLDLKKQEDLQQQQPKRYAFEELLIKKAWEHDLPLLGICRGYQMMVEVLGGEMKAGVLKGHKQNTNPKEKHHWIDLVKDSYLHRICNRNQWYVNSLHKQEIASLPQGLMISAKSGDGVIEAIEAINKRFFIGVQFHPEELLDIDEEAKKLFKAFIDEAKLFRRKKLDLKDWRDKG